MKTRFLVGSILLMICTMTVAQAQEKATLASVYTRAVKNVAGEVVPATDAMPDDKFNFAPTAGEFKGVRTFAEQAKHIAAVNYIVGATILGEKPPVDVGEENGPANITSKSDVMKYLKDSFEYAGKAAGSITDANALTDIKSAFGDRPTNRIAMATLLVAHPFDHYGQMVEYLRMNGIVPPASRPQPKK